MRQLLLLLSLAATLATLADTDGRVKLREGEGLLLLPIESNSELRKLRFVRDNPEVETADIDDIEIGRHLRLFRLPAGEWRLTYLRLDGRWETRWTHDDVEAPRFSVVAGRVTYCGEIHLSNRNTDIRAVGGNYGLAELPVMLRNAARIRPDLLAAYPLALCKHLNGVPKLAPETAVDVAGWLRAIGADPQVDDLARVNRVLAKIGQSQLAHGQAFAMVKEAYAKAPRRYLRLASYAEDPRWLWLELRGLWGEQGAALRARLAFVDGKLERVSLIAMRNSRWLPVGTDSQEDLDGWLGKQG